MSEIELILTKLKIVSEAEEQGCYLCDKEHSKILLKEIERLRNALEYVMEQVYGAMTKNWCVDLNFTDIRETFNIPNRFDEEEPYNTDEEQQDYLWEQIDEDNIELGE